MCSFEKKKRDLQSKTHEYGPPALNPYGKRHWKSCMDTGGVSCMMRESR